MNPEVVLLEDQEKIGGLTFRAGQSLIDDHEVEVVLLAGGEGRRLGFDGPKCLYPICGKPIIEHLLVKIPSEVKISVMTNKNSYRKIVNSVGARCGVFTQSKTFGYDSSLVQTNSTFPSGHGDFFDSFIGNKPDAIRRSESLRKVIVVCQADNPITPVCCRELIGLHHVTRSQVTAVVVPRKHPEEKMGMAHSKDGRSFISEYGAGQDLSNLKWGNIGAYVFHTAFLLSLPSHDSEEDVLKYHLRPQADGSFRREKFIFDLIPLAKRSQFVEMKRDDVFAPVKDAETAAEAERLVAALLD